MAYGFKLGQIEGLDSSVKKVNLTITGTTTASYVLNYGNEGGDEGWTDNVENPNFTLHYHLELDEYVLIAFNTDETDVGDEYTINLSLPEAPTQAFKEAVELVLPSPIFDITQTLDFSNLETTATVDGNSFTKISTTSLTAEQLDGATFKMGEDGTPITSDMLSDMSALGVTGTLITLPSPFGPIVFSCTEAGSVVSEPGFYLVTQMLSYVDYVTLSYQETHEATVRAVATGTAELTDNASSLPDGVIYLQIEG